MSKHIVSLVIIVAALVSYSSISAQEAPYNIYDSEGRFFQYKGHSVIEYADKYYVLGMAMDTLLPTIERNLQITSFDKGGSVLASIMWDNPAFENESISTSSKKIHIVNDRLVVPYGSRQDCVVSIDVDLQEDFRLEACDLDQGDPFIRKTVTSQLTTANEILVIQSSVSKENFYISKLDTDDAFSYEAFEINPVTAGRHLALQIFEWGPDSLLVYGISSDQSAPNREDHRFSTMVYWLDKDLNLLGEQVIERDYSGNSITSKALVDGGCLISSARRLDRDYYISENENEHYDVISKIDLSSSEVLWETPIDTAEFGRRQPIVTDLEMSHQGDGYIWVGWGYTSSRPNANTLIFGKMSTAGEVVWRYEIEDQYLLSDLNAYEVLATSDGNYLITGYRSSTDEDEYTTLIQLILMKFDEEGKVLDFSTSLSETQEDLALSIVPNPAQDVINIHTAYGGGKHIYLTDLQGVPLRKISCDSHDCVIDSSDLPTGTYVLLVADGEGNYIGREKVMVLR